MPVTFTRATKEFARARVGLVGPAGSGKTFTGLLLATNMGDRIAVIDTERGSASKYAHRFSFDHVIFETFDPRAYIDAIESAAGAKYDVLLIDSLSHAWSGKGGALDLQAAAVKRSKSGNSFDAWREITPIHNDLVDAMLQAPLHIIATMRTHVEYVVEEQQRNGRTIHVPKKVGMKPIQREGLDFEFDIVGDMDDQNTWTITKSRCEDLNGKTINRPDQRTAKVILDWLTDGVPQVQGGQNPEAGVVDGTPPHESPSMRSSPTPAPAGSTSMPRNLQPEQEQANADRARVDNATVTKSDAAPGLSAGKESVAAEGGPAAQPEQELKPSVSPASSVPSQTPIEEICNLYSIPPQRAWLFLMQQHREQFSDLRKVGDFLALEGDQALFAIQKIEEEFGGVTAEQ